MTGDVSRLLEAVPIETYIGRFVPLKRKGSNFWGLCPFHSEKSPSFSVAPAKGIFKCFGCGKGGDLISFIREYERTDFRGALVILSEYSGIPLTAANPVQDNARQSRKKSAYKANILVSQWFASALLNSPASEYLTQRKVEITTSGHFGIGYAPPSNRFLEEKSESFFNSDPAKIKSFIETCKDLGLIALRDSGESYNRFRDRLIFPIKNLQGNVIAFGGRILNEEAKAAKYVNSPESEIFSKKNTLFHLYEAKDSIRKNQQAILVEGYFDVLGLFQAGIDNAIAPLGTAFTPEQARTLKRFTDTVIIFLDNDKAGIEASFSAVREARRVKLQCRVVKSTADEKRDPFDLAQKLSRIQMLELLDDARNELEFLLWYFFQYQTNIQNFDDRRKATARFFEFLRAEATSEFEISEFIKAAAVLLQTESNILMNDFKRGQTQNLSVREPPKSNQKPVVEKNANRLEREVLALLLWFPALWSEQELLNQHEWEAEVTALAYGFLRDRITSGEMITWQSIKEAFAFLPVNLTELFAGILLEFEEELSSISNSEEPENLYRNKLKILILDAAIKKTEAEIKSLNSRIQIAEKTGLTETDRLIETITIRQGELYRKKAARQKYLI